MSPEAKIIVHGREASVDLHLARLAEFAGVCCRTVRADLPDSLSQFLSDRQSLSCIMISAGSLAAILQDKAMPRNFVADLFSHTRFILIYGVTALDEKAGALRHVTDGLVSAVVSFERSDHQYRVSSCHDGITEEFSGLSFGPIHKDRDFGLVVNGSKSGFSDIVTVNDQPLFGFIKKQDSELFVLACRDISNLGSKSNGSLSAHEHFSQTCPVLMFLRHAFAEQTWRNPRRCATFIIDDPLLQRSYGFLNYSRLLAEMDGCDFTANIAFIPWNHKRTDPDVAKLIISRSSRFFVCVHGCDHTAGEFANTDISDLNIRTHLATERMKSHERRTGVPYDDVMVFPQGKFSSESLGVLKGHNYLAAVNSSVIPQDLTDSHGLTIADLLAPAVSKYSSFPLFSRRYPRELADVALDLFLGKPAVLVEHHSYFKDGYERIREFTSRINSLSPRLQWMGLGQLIRNTYLQKQISDDTIECRIFANRQVIHNPAPVGKRFMITKCEDEVDAIEKVAVDGKQHPFEVREGYLRLNVQVPPATAIDIKIEYRNPHPSVRRRNAQPFRNYLKVYLRRHLSEARDNYLCRHGKLLSLAYKVKNWSSL